MRLEIDEQKAGLVDAPHDDPLRTDRAPERGGGIRMIEQVARTFVCSVLCGSIDCNRGVFRFSERLFQHRLDGSRALALLGIARVERQIVELELQDSDAAIGGFRLHGSGKRN